MPEPEADPTPSPDAPQKGPGKREVYALGIGCLVFVIFLVAIVIVGMMREGGPG